MGSYSKNEHTIKTNNLTTKHIDAFLSKKKKKSQWSPHGCLTTNGGQVGAELEGRRVAMATP